MVYYSLYSAAEITQLEEKTFIDWLDFLYHNPTEFADFIPETPRTESHEGGTKLPKPRLRNEADKPDTRWLHECWCEGTEAHARLKKFRHHRFFGNEKNH